MKSKELDINKLEEVKFEIEKKAFKPKILHCSNCNLKMRKTELEIQINESIYMKLEGFECPKCNKKYLGLEESKKLDKAMMFNRAFSENFRMERKLSFDGDNYTFRIPKEFTYDVHKRKIDITPLSTKKFCAVIE